jgi:hypothetical protein
MAGDCDSGGGPDSVSPGTGTFTACAVPSAIISQFWRRWRGRHARQNAGGRVEMQNRDAVCPRSDALGHSTCRAVPPAACGFAHLHCSRFGLRSPAPGSYGPGKPARRCRLVCASRLSVVLSRRLSVPLRDTENAPPDRPEFFPPIVAYYQPAPPSRPLAMVKDRNDYANPASACCISHGAPTPAA